MPNLRRTEAEAPVTFNRDARATYTWWPASPGAVRGPRLFAARIVDPYGAAVWTCDHRHDHLYEAQDLQLVEDPDRRLTPGQWDLHPIVHLEYCLN